MNIAAMGSVHERPTSASRLLSLQSVSKLNVEMLTTDSLLQANRKSEIRFNAGGAL
jgi:hypothetical protein